tara:strand:- start:29842 stop:30291 length:450 start_codon:yes stop_codon:yes gene_type:complete
VSYDENQKLLNENGITKLSYGSLEWDNYLRKLKSHSFCKVSVESVSSVVSKGLEAEYKKVESFEYIIDEIDVAMEGAKKALTAEEQRIQVLEAKLELLLNPKKEVVKSEPKGDELNEVREEYTKLFGEKPHHLVKIETLREKIKEELNK